MQPLQMTIQIDANAHVGVVFLPCVGAVLQDVDALVMLLFSVAVCKASPHTTLDP